MVTKEIRVLALVACALSLIFGAASCTRTNMPPIARFSVSPASGPAPLTVVEDGSGSHDPDGNIVLYRWESGDGASTEGQDAQIYHIYTVAGTYTASLTVTDNSGASDTATQTIVVESPAPPVQLRFSGAADELTDPFTLPSGSYRAHLQTTGFAIVHVIPEATPDHIVYLFNVMDGDANDGVSKLYVSGGGRIMLEFSNISAPYEFWFEKIS